MPVVSIIICFVSFLIFSNSKYRNSKFYQNIKPYRGFTTLACGIVLGAYAYLVIGGVAPLTFPMVLVVMGFGYLWVDKDKWLHPSDK